MRKFFVYLITASLVLTPILVGAQQAEKPSGNSSPDTTAVKAQAPVELPPAKEGECETAKMEGAKEGARETNKMGWSVVGMFFPLSGPFIAACANPSQPSEAALHFSANPACFTQGYHNKKKNGRIKSAFFGTLLILSLEVLVIVSDRSSNTQY
jgi:hypothetical protein